MPGYNSRKPRHSQMPVLLMTTTFFLKSESPGAGRYQGMVERDMAHGIW